MIHATGLDFETYGEESIRDVGLENYVTQPSFQVLTATLAEVVDGIPVNDRFFDFVIGGNTALDNFKRAMRTLDTVCAHNAAFEQRVLEFLGARIPGSVLWDTAVMSRQEGGSSSLAQAAAQLLPAGVGKLDEGSRLIRKFSMGPTPPTAESVKNDPDWQAFAEYNIRDARISAMLATGHWYQCAPRKDIDYPSTYRMNREGWFVDIPLVKEISKRYEQNKKDLLDEFHANFTKPGEEPLNFRSHTQKKAFCEDRGVKAVSFDEMHVERYLVALDKKMQDPKLEPGKATQYAEVYQMLKVHQQLGGSSLSKIPKILALTSKDGRLRDQYMHCGAGQTFRTSGVGVQMQNLKRLSTIRDVETIYDPNVEWSNDDLASNLRQVFRAEHPDGRLIVGDLSSVESRGLAFLAGETWKLEEYQAGRDLYISLASKMFNLPYDSIDKHSPERSAGKVGELSCGYGAAATAVHSFAQKMGIDMSEAEAAKLVSDWRAQNPNIVEFWATLQRLLEEALAGRQAIYTRDDLQVGIVPITAPESLQAMHPGAVSLLLTLKYAGELVVSRVFHGCYRRGRDICYYKHSDRKTGDPWNRSYEDPKTKRREYYRIYGGKLAGILTQSFCREIFFVGLSNLSRALRSAPNVKLVGQFHDEIVVEWTPPAGPVGGMSLEEVEELMDAWMCYSQFQGFPLAAEIKSDHRYIK